MAGHRASAVVVLVVLAVLGCEAPTHKAIVRREAERRLSSCLSRARGFLAGRKACAQESKAFCQANGLETSCGTDGYFIPARRR